MKHVADILAEFLEDLEAPTGGTAVSLSAARIRKRVHQPDLWAAGAEGEQLVFDCGGTAVAR